MSARLPLLREVQQQLAREEGLAGAGAAGEQHEAVLQRRDVLEGLHLVGAQLHGHLVAELGREDVVGGQAVLDHLLVAVGQHVVLGGQLGEVAGLDSLEGQVERVHEAVHDLQGGWCGGAVSCLAFREEAGRKLHGSS